MIIPQTFIERYQNDVSKIKDIVFQKLNQTRSSTLQDINLYAQQMDGQFLRSMFILSFCESKNATKEKTIKCCSMIELLHLASLVHDDIIDKSLMRRGQKTLNAQFGVPKSMLFGDLCFANGFSLIEELNLKRLLPGFNQTVKNMIESQFLELDYQEKNSPLKTNDIIELKTASMFSLTFECAGTLAKESENTIGILKYMGKLFGNIYQIHDDMLNLKLLPRKPSKDIMTDYFNNQFNFVINLVKQQSTQQELNLLEYEQHQNKTSQLNQLIKKYDLIEKCFQHIDNLCHELTKVTSSLKSHNSFISLLISLIDSEIALKRRCSVS